MAAGLVPILLFFGVWVVVITFLRVARKKKPLFLVLFSLFFFYLCAVLDLTLFQFQALLLLKPLVPGLILNGLPPGKELNLVPLVTLTGADLKTSVLNILMMVPLGLGLPFLSRLRFAPTVLGGLLLSLAIEVLQLTTGLLAGTSFRVADVNDVLFNTLGVAVGYALFAGALKVRALGRDPVDLPRDDEGQKGDPS